MDRRGFLRTALMGAGAAATAMVAGKVEAREPAPKVTPAPISQYDPETALSFMLAEGYHLPPSGMQTFMISTPSKRKPFDGDYAAQERAEQMRQDWATRRLVTGPDPATMVYVGLQSNGFVTIGGEPWVGSEHLIAIPRAAFPEYDERHGITVLFNPLLNRVPPDKWTVPVIRAYYLDALKVNVAVAS